MQRTNISPTVYQDLFESAPNAGVKGQAQFFTPLEWARVLSIPLPKYRPVIVDLSCGNGQLITAAAGKSTKALLGVEIQPPDGHSNLTWSAALSANRVTGDVTKFYPLLKTVDWQADLFVLNPPWDLHWHRDRLKALEDSDCPAVRSAFEAHDGRTAKANIDSTVATLCMALDRSSPYGEGVLIGNEASLQRLILADGAPHGALRSHVWAHMMIQGNICSDKGSSTDSDFRTGILYFARSHTSGPGAPLGGSYCADYKNLLPGIESLLKSLSESRTDYRRGASVKPGQSCEDSVELWQAAAAEWKVLSGTARDNQWNLWLDYDGCIRTNLSVFDQHAKRGTKDEAARLFSLNGKHPMQLVLQRNERKELERAAFGTTWRVQPQLQAAVKNAIEEYNRVRAPLVPLSKIQRLGYLDETDDIVCERQLKMKNKVAFRAGQRYTLRTQTVQVKRSGEKMNLIGLLDAVEWEGSELAIFIKDESGEERLFMEGRLRDKNVKIAIGDALTDDEAPNPIDFTLHELVEHFTIPEVPDVAQTNPDGFAAMLKQLDEIERIAA